jgi:hypothetical protein
MDPAKVAHMVEVLNGLTARDARLPVGWVHADGFKRGTKQ